MATLGSWKLGPLQGSEKLPFVIRLAGAEGYIDTHLKLQIFTLTVKSLSDLKQKWDLIKFMILITFKM